MDGPSFVRMAARQLIVSQARLASIGDPPRVGLVAVGRGIVIQPDPSGFLVDWQAPGRAGTPGRRIRFRGWEHLPLIRPGLYRTLIKETERPWGVVRVIYVIGCLSVPARLSSRRAPWRRTRGRFPASDQSRGKGS